MSYSRFIRSTASVVALSLGTAAFADVTAPEVWENWSEAIAVSGEDVLSVGSEDYSDGTLTVSDVTLSFSDAQDTVTAPIGDIVLEEQGDGTVRVTMAESYPITIESEGATLTLNVTQTGLDLVVSGEPDAMNYAVSADQYMIALDELNDPENGSPEGDAMIAMNDVTGNYTTTGGDLREMTYDLAVSSIDVLMDLAEAESATDVLISGKINGLDIDADLVLPMDVDYDNPDDIFTKGLSVTANYGYADSSYLFELSENGTATNGTVSTGAANVDVALSRMKVLYDVAVNAVAVDATSTDLPFPVSVSLEEYAIRFDAPLNASDEVQPFSAGINLSELTLNDEVWMLFDPAGQLERGPATARIDLSGEGRLLFDVTDPAQQEAMSMSEMPGELESLRLNDLTLRVAGAEVKGEGAFTFDNTDLQTFSGIPRPEGEITIDILGANRLIDSLVAMGLIPEDQAMMGRMMMGMFAQTTGDDQLRSVIEINDQGHVLANGQRLQ